MSWSRRQVWRLLAAAAAIAPLAGLAACGFQPLYGSDGRRNLGDESVAASLATVRIDPLRDRAGQQMHNFLRDRLNPEGQPVSPSYRLGSEEHTAEPQSLIRIPYAVFCLKHKIEQHT